MIGDRLVVAVRLALAATTVIACGGDEPTGTGAIPAGATLALTVSNVPALDPGTGGRLEAWVIDAQGSAHALGTVTPSVQAPISFTTPVGNPASFLITYEPG